jgi:hypothetical protein
LGFMHSCLDVLLSFSDSSQISSYHFV